MKTVTWEPGMTRDLWWQPYDRTLGDAIRASTRLIYGRNGHRARALPRGRRAAPQGGRAHAAQGPLAANP